MNKKNIIIISIVVILIVVSTITGYVIYHNNKLLKETPTNEEIFNPNSGNKNEELAIYDNQVNITFNLKKDFNSIKRLLKENNATIDGTRESTINYYTVTVNENFKSLEDIKTYCDTLKNKYSEIEACEVVKIPEDSSCDENKTDPC